MAKEEDKPIELLRITITNQNQDSVELAVDYPEYRIEAKISRDESTNIIRKDHIRWLRIYQLLSCGDWFAVADFIEGRWISKCVEPKGVITTFIRQVNRLSLFSKESVIFQTKKDN